MTSNGADRLETNPVREDEKKKKSPPHLSGGNSYTVMQQVEETLMI